MLMVTLFFVFLAATQYFRFENSDDILFVKGFLGYEGGSPIGFTLYNHTLAARFLQGISLLFPGVPWFSLVQIGLLWLSNVVICKSLLLLTADRKPGWLTGLAAGCLYLAVFSLFLSCRLNYTTTSALLGAASIAQLLSVPVKEASPGSVLRGVLLSLLLLACCYCLRMSSAFPSFVFWALALLTVYSQRRQAGVPSAGKPLAIGLMTGLLLFTALLALRSFEIHALHLEAFMDWSAARTSLLDYHEAAFDLVSDAQLQAVGWSRAELALVREWYLMDQNITTEALTQLAQVHMDATTAGFFPRLGASLQALGSFYASNPAYLFSGGVLLSLCLLGVVASFQKERKPWLLFSCLALTVLPFAMLVSLHLSGRFLARAADCALLPAAAFLLCLVMPHFPWRQGGTLRRVLTGFLCLALLASALGSATATWKQLKARPDMVSPTRQAALEAYGLAHPDQLVLYSPNLLRDTRLFPDVSAGIPTNLMLWGDWYCRTPSWNAQLASHGIDPASFSAKDFLRSNLVFVSAEADPPAHLLSYLTEGVGASVQPVRIAQSGDLSFFQFSGI